MDWPRRLPPIGFVMDGAKCSACLVYVCDCECPGVTGYSKKRRLLREHRKTMRVYEQTIDDMGPYAQMAFADNLAQSDAQDWVLEENVSELDETSDHEDPEAELAKERDTTQAFVQAAQDALAAEALRRELERKSMQLEDLRSRLVLMDWPPLHTPDWLTRLM